MASRHDPFEQMNRFFEQTHRSLRDGNQMARQSTGDANTHFHVDETDDGYVVMADLPGFERADLAVRFDDGILTVQGETSATETADGAARSLRRQVSERVRLPDPVRTEDVAASYHNGVLEISLPTEFELADDDHVIDIE
jgi:HSP20 family protein